MLVLHGRTGPCRAVDRSKNPNGRGEQLHGRYNLTPHPIEKGLNDLPKSGGGERPPPAPLVPTAPTCGTGGTGPAGLSKLVLYCRISCSKGPFSRGALHTFCYRLRTYDGYFPNSFRPISNLGYIWVRSEKQTFLWKTTTELWTSAKYHKIHSANLPNWPKSFGYR